MKIFMMMVALVLSTVTINANPITCEQAQKRAEIFMDSRHDIRKLVPVVSSKKLPPKWRGVANRQMQEYYVFNRGTSEGFVIVSGDDRTEPVLGYCDRGEFDYEQLPPQLQMMLDGYAHQIKAIQMGAPVNKLPARHPKVEQLMSSQWSQGAPYNNLCPLDDGHRSVTGCVATAMAQILYYHREKSVTETTAAIPGYSTWTKNISVQGIAAGSPIDWANMRDTYGSASDIQKNAVAQLMLYCGVAAKMDYTNSASGAQSSDAYEAFAKYFGYGKSVKFVTYQDVTSDDDWDRIVYAEMEAGRPVYVSGSNAEVGHAFVADGYDGNLRYHINWGWGGQSDGYYYLTNLTPGDGQGIGGSSDGYNSWKQIIVGIEPENYSEKVMSFSEITVKNICIGKWDTNGDGRLTYGEAAAVTDLGDAFKGNTNIKKFPELYYFSSLTSLPDDAFNGCTQLATLRLPKSLKSIGARALKDCRKLTQINLPTGVCAIGEEAFDGCLLLESFELTNDISSIEKGTFRNCTAIASVNLPINVGSIGDEAFAGCKKLSSFTVNTYHPSDIVMGNSVFENVDLSKAKLCVMQGTKSFFEITSQWKDFGSIIQMRDISAGKFVALESGKTYYLYNVGTGRYLTKGEAYKTQAVVGTEPMRFKLVHPTTKPENIYYFTSPDTGNDGKYLFRTSTDGNVGKGVKATFVDGKNLNNNSYWNVTAIGDNIYTIQLPDTETGYNKNEYLGVQTDHESDAATPTYGVYWDVAYDNYAKNCRWQFVLYDETSTRRFTEAETLAKLLSTANKRNLMVADEQSVYDNLESTIEELLTAQSSLRKKLKFIDFYHKDMREMCVSYFDSDTDGELSYKEASDVTDFGWLFNFMNNTSLVHADELQYFTNAQAIHGNFMQGCTNLETIVLPKGLDKIYYYAFKGCKKLSAINIPKYVNLIGDEAFEGCSSLRTVTVAVPDPSYIELGSNVFGNVPLAKCTLQVPYGSKALYEKTAVWKNFGEIVEVRAQAQPKYSPIEVNVAGYILNVATRKYVAMGEAYGTQSVVAVDGLPYQFKHTKAMPDSVYYLESGGKTLFRTDTDGRVGSGIKACFGDGSVSSKAYWKIRLADDHTFTMQLPESDPAYVADEFLGVNENHRSDAASPTCGLYWDVKGNGSRWAFVTTDDLKAALLMDSKIVVLADMLKRANDAGLDVNDEQAVYDNFDSTLEEITNAVASVRDKLHYITFSDAKAQTICLANWDTNGDEELSFEEAAAVTDIGTIFGNVTNLKSLEELRYFTSIKEIPDNAFRGSSSLQTVYLPAGVSSIGSYAFMQTSVKNLILLNDKQLIPLGVSGVPNRSLLFVPPSVLEAYNNDESWSARCVVVEYTGKPVVSAEASRIYGRSVASIKMKVSGAPVEGEASFECEAIKDSKLPVGTYPIKVTKGSISTPNVECREGVFTVEPAPLTITAMSYTRNVGLPNPEFEVTYSAFRNKETDTVFTVRPVITCDATIDSPAGEYEIVVSGAEASNYAISYVNGKLTVVDDPSRVSVVVLETQNEPVYDLQGRRVKTPQRGVYIKNKRKLIVK